MNGKEFKEFLNKKVKQENIGRAASITQDAEKIYNGLQSQYNDFVEQTQSGKTLSQQDLRIYKLALADLQKLTPLTGFDTATKKQLNQLNQNLKDGTDILLNYNKNVLAREEAYRKLDDVKKKQTGNFLFGLESEKDKTAAERAQLKKQSIALKDEISKYDAAIAPYLDVKATRKQLDNTSFFAFKAHDRAKTDYQNAREQKTGREAEEWLQDKEVKQLSVQAGTAAAAQETIDSSGNKANLKAAKEARYFSQYKDKLKSTIKGRGYKDSDDELDKLVDEIVRRGKMDVTEKQQIDISKKLQEYTKAHPVIGSFAAAAAGTVAKVPGAKYALSQAIKGFISDERVYNDPNSAYFFGSNAYNQVTTAVKDEIAKHIENKYDDPEVIANKTKKAQMMYDGAMSGLENIIRAVTTAGVGEAYALVPMALAQLSDIALQKTIEGYSPTDAGYYAFIGAVAEYATEKMGLDALFGKVPGGRGMIVGYLTKLFKVGAAEGGEEIVSDVINDAADCLYEFLSDKKSVREKEISHLMREGMSYKEAAEAYTHNKINEYIDDAVMGAAVGAVLGGGSTAVNISARTANIARNLSASKQQAQAANQQTVNAIQAEFGGRLTAEAAADVAKERGQWIDGNAYYENLIEQAKNSYDPKVAQMGIDAEDDYRYQRQMKDGRVSIAKAGRLINHISAANIRATTGMATQMLESVGAKSATVKAVVNAINGEELSRKDIKNIKNSPDALSMLSQLYQDNTGEAIFLSAESDNDTIREVAGAVQGATFNIDRNTDAGKLYSTAARMRADGDIGFNGMKGFLSGYRDNLNMSLEEYANMFKLAYNESKAGKSPEAIAEHIHSIFAASEADEATTSARDAAILRAALTAQNDIEHENKQAKKEKKEAKQEAEEDVTDSLHSKSGLEEDTSEADPVTKAAVESAKKLSRLSESEKAEKFKNGGAIVESTKKLTTQQSAIISFYDFRGKKHGITYRFVDSIESNAGARGEYNHQTEVITIRIGEVADMTATAGHELGHWLKAHYPEEYARMQQYLKDTVFKTNYEAKVAAKIAAYKKADITIDEEAAFEELTNDCLFGVDMASEDFEAFVKANESLMQKAFRVIRELLEDLQHFMEDWRKQLPGMYKQVTEIKMVQELYDDVEFMEYTADWVDGILNQNAVSEQSASSEQTTDAGEQKNSTTVASGVRYSVKDNQDKNSDIVDLTNSGLAEQLEGIYGKERRKAIASYILNKLNNNTIHFIDGLEAIVDKKDANHISNRAPKNEVAAIEKFEELINKSFPYAEENNPMHNGKQHNKFIYFRYYKVDVKLGAENYSLFLNVGKARVDGKYHFYDITTKIRDTAIRLNGHERLSEYLSAYGISINSISDSSEKSNSSFQVSDADYLEAARNGDDAKAAEYVKQAAKEWGAFSDGKPEPINLYHGTKSFGFTEFDLQKMDDGRSIFLTSDLSTAQSYSGTFRKRRVSSDYKDYKLSELVKPLKNYYRELGIDNDNRVEYFSQDRINSLIKKVKKHLELIKPLIEQRNNSDSYDENDELEDESLLNCISIFLENISDVETAQSELYKMSKRIWECDGYLYERLGDDKLESIHSDLDILNDVFEYQKEGVITIKYRWNREIYTKDKIIRVLKKNGNGNYSLYARLNNPLVINCNGRNWNNIEYAYNKVSPILRRRSTTIKTGTTREISEYAQKNGYDGVIFKNIRDNGGRGVKNSGVADYIAVAFDSAQVKSADPITYDDNGEIIPLSERFSESKDIRFQVADTVEETKDLIAVHNLSEEKLMKSLELGGMPMPSIAVMKAKNNHHDFGNISLVFSKDTIDPEKGAKVWTGDAYTPTFPQVEYKLSDKATDVYMTALDLQRSGMVDNFRSIRFDPDNMFDRLNNLDFEDLIRKELQDYSTKMLYLYDTTGTVDAVELENIDKSNFEKWTRNLYESIIEKKGIKNNRDIYTSSGNRRSWEALHYEYNLENLVRAMKEKGTQGIGAFGSTITGASKVEFNSVEDIKNNRDKLLDKTSPEIKKAYDETRKGITDRFYELARSLPKYDNFTAIDDAAEMLTEAVLKFKTKTGMDNYIREQCEGWAHYSPSIVDDLLDIVNELRNLPAAYFEAKPQRGVSFNEVYTAVIPDNASADLIAALDKAGVKYQTYEAGNEEDRVRVINSLDEVKFQISDTTLTPEQQAAIERKATSREMAKLERENENLKAALDAALKQTKLSKDFRHDESKTAQIAKKLLRK
ncbi:MAG: hypothetical protein IJG23_02230, partial [Clostridia bacterium]|nr:hypothetical protein [Clostridia bacterium]